MVTTDLQEKINIIFKDDENIKNRLLNGEEEAIRELATSLGKSIDPLDIIIAYENKDFDSLYKRAQQLIQIRELYVAMCKWYAEHNDEIINTK